MKVLQELISAGFKRATLQEHSTEERLGERPFNSHPKKSSSEPAHQQCATRDWELSK